MSFFYVNQILLSLGIFLNSEEILLFSPRIMDPLNFLYLIYQTRKMDSDLKKSKCNFLRIFKELNKNDQFILKLILLKKIHIEESNKESVNLLFSKFEFKKTMRYYDSFSFNLYTDYDNNLRQFKRKSKNEDYFKKFWILKNLLIKFGKDTEIKIVSKCYKFIKETTFAKLKLIENNLIIEKLRDLINYEDLYRVYYGHFPNDKEFLKIYKNYWEIYFSLSKKFPIFKFSFQKFYDNFEDIVDIKFKYYEELKKKLKFIIKIRKLRNNFDEEIFNSLISELNLKSNFEYFLTIFQLLLSNKPNDFQILFDLFNIKKDALKITLNIINKVGHENKFEIINYLITKMNFPNILYETLNSFLLLFFKPDNYLKDENNFEPFLKLIKKKKTNEKFLLKIIYLNIYITKTSEHIFKLPENLKKKFLEYLNLFKENGEKINYQRLIYFNSAFLSDYFDSFIFVNNYKDKYFGNYRNQEDVFKESKYITEFCEKYIEEKLKIEDIEDFLINFIFQKKRNEEICDKTSLENYNENNEKIREKVFNLQIKNENFNENKILETEENLIKKVDLMIESETITIKTDVKIKSKKKIIKNKINLNEKKITFEKNLRIFSDVILLIFYLDFKNTEKFIENLKEINEEIYLEILLNFFFHYLLIKNKEINSDLHKDVFLWKILNINKDKKFFLTKNKIEKNFLLKEFKDFDIKEKLEDIKKINYNKKKFYERIKDFNIISRFEDLNSKKKIKNNFLKNLNKIFTKEVRGKNIFQEKIFCNEKEFLDSIENFTSLPSKLEENIIEKKFDSENLFKIIIKGMENLDLKYFNIKKNEKIIKFFFIPLYYILEFVYPIYYWKNRIENKEKKDEYEILKNKFKIFFLLIDYTLKNYKGEHIFISKLKNIQKNKEHIFFINKMLLDISIKPYNTYSIILKVFLRILKKSPKIKNFEYLFLKNFEIAKKLIDLQFFQKSINLVIKLSKNFDKESLGVFINLQIDIIQKITKINTNLKIPLKLLFNIINNKKTFIKEIISMCENKNLRETLKKQLLSFLLYNKIMKNFKFKKNKIVKNINIKTKEDIFNIKIYYLEDIKYILKLLDINLDKLEIANILLKTKKDIVNKKNNFIFFKDLLFAIEEYIILEVDERTPFFLPNIVFCLFIIEIVDFFLGKIFSNTFNIELEFGLLINLVLHLVLFFVLNYVVLFKFFFWYLMKDTDEFKKNFEESVYKKLKYNV